METPVTDAADELFQTLVDDPDTPGGLEETAQAREVGNFLRHVISLSASKVADGLLNPKLVLSWLLTTLGAGSFLTGLLVPVRESGALLPQLFTTPYITSSRIRKWYWAGGSIVQGACAGGIALAGVTLEGQAAGILIVVLLGLLALARSVCSASYKDILGKTVGKSRRGTATGFAASAASAGVILFAVLLLLGLIDRFTLVIAAIVLASVLWITGGLVFARMREVESEPQNGEGIGLGQFSLLKDRPQLKRFILVRSLLVGTALAPPYLVLLQPDGALGALGALVLASAIASLLSSYVWGRLSDRSSRRVLLYAGIAGGAVLAAIAAMGWLGLAGVPLLVPVMLFGLMISYHGVRQGRSTHLVDMAGPEDRASYTALSNTMVGIVLIVAGVAAAGVSALSVPLTLLVFAGMAMAGAWLSLGLDEVQSDAG